VNMHEGAAISEFVVSPHFGSPPAAGLLRQQLVGALGGESEGSGWAVPGPQAVSSTSATNHLGISEQRLQRSKRNALPVQS